MEKIKYNEFDSVLGEEYNLLKMAYPHYDEFEDHIGKTIVEHFKNDPIDTINALEIGSGTGITTKVLLECDQRVNVTCVDNEEKMMVQLRANIEQWSGSLRSSLVQKEIEDYFSTIEDNTFDVVASGFVIHNMDPDTKRRVVAESYRVLKPGGIFVNGDKYANSDPVLRKEIFDKQIERYNVYDSIGRSDYKKEWLEHMQDDERPDRIFIENEAKDYMTSIGFKKVTTNYREMMEAVISGVK